MFPPTLKYYHTIVYLYYTPGAKKWLKIKLFIFLTANYWSENKQIVRKCTTAIAVSENPSKTE